MTEPPADPFSLLQAALEPQYRLEGELGRGGMGVVYQATDRTLDRRVAVKVVHPELAAHPTIAQRFLAEARMLARIRHPNIVAVHHAGRAGELPYYVMDAIPGASLRQRLAREGTLSPAATRQVMADIAAALDAAGRAGFVHRDVKPENVLLDATTGRALLADFGIARPSDGSGFDTAGQGIAVGTPTYMSPEQAAGEPVDARSDLYALGVVAYEALTGQPPFVGPNRVVVSRHISDRPTPVGRLRPDTPAPLAQAIMRALEKAPADRWQTGEELHRALVTDSAAARPGRSRPRARRRVAVAAAALLLLGAAALGLRYLRPAGPPAGINPRHSMLILPFSNLRDDRAMNWLRDGSVSMLGLNLSQWADLSVVDHARVHDLLAHHGLAPGDPIGLEQAVRLAREAGVWTVVVGEFSRSGDSLLVVARVFDVASGRRVDIARVEGLAPRDVRPLYDRLAARLLDLSGAPSEIHTGLAQATTASVDAFRAYLAGVELLNRWQLPAAQREFERAIALDSTFSLAYYKLAITLGWTAPADSTTRLAMQRAMRSMGRLPARDQMVISAYQAFVSGDYETARGLYNQLLARDGRDREAWYGLGEAWFHDTVSAEFVSRHTAAYRAFRRALAIDPSYALPHYHILDMLRMASTPHPLLLLVAADSFAPGYGGKDGPLDSAAVALAIRRARRETVAQARGWVVAQPTTENAHDALVRAYLTAGDFPAAMAELDRYDRSVPGYAALPFARAQVRFAAGEADRAAVELRRALDTLSADAFGPDISHPTVASVSAATNIFAYLGDLEHATRVIDLANELERRLDTGVGRQGSPVRQTRLNWLMRGQLYAAVGGQAAALRRIWDGARDAGRAAATPEDGVALWTSGGAAALGLLTLPEPDTAAYAEYRRLTGRPAQREVQALLALARGDSGAARRALAAPEPPWRGSEEPFPVWVRPLAALAHFRIGEYEAALRAVDEFDPFAFSTSDFDMRWGLLPRVRLLRAAAYERLSRPDEARREYRLVLEQWRAADPSLRPYLNEAGRELARLGEPAERLSALGYQLSATPGVRGGRCEPPPPVGGRQQP